MVYFFSEVFGNILFFGGIAKGRCTQKNWFYQGLLQMTYFLRFIQNIPNLMKHGKTKKKYLFPQKQSFCLFLSKTKHHNITRKISFKWDN